MRDLMRFIHKGPTLDEGILKKATRDVQIMKMIADIEVMNRLLLEKMGLGNAEEEHFLDYLGREVLIKECIEGNIIGSRINLPTNYIVIIGWVDADMKQVYFEQTPGRRVTYALPLSESDKKDPDFAAFLEDRFPEYEVNFW